MLHERKKIGTLHRSEFSIQRSFNTLYTTTFIKSSMKVETLAYRR